MARARSEGHAVVDVPDPRLEAIRGEALALLESGAAEGGRPWVRLARAELYFLRHEFDKATQAIDGLHYAHAKAIRGLIAEGQNDYDTALYHFDAAVVTQPNFWQAHVRRALLRGRLSQTNSSLEMAQAAKANWDELVDAWPDADARVGRSFIHWCMGNIVAERGDDPTPHYRAAIADAEAALALDGANVHAWANLATAYSELGHKEIDRGGDPTEPFAEAVKAYDRLVALDASFTDMACNRDNKFLLLGRWRMSHGLDPSEAFAKAAAGAERTDVYSRVTLSNVRIAEAEWAEARGEDPADRYAAAIRYARDAVSGGPSSAVAARALAKHLSQMGRWRSERGQDPTEAFNEAGREFARAIELDPRDADVHEARALMLMVRGDAGAALESLDTAIALRPHSPTASGLRGKALRIFGERTAERGGDPSAPYREGVEALEAALRVNENSGDAWNDLGLIHQKWAEWEARIPRDPTARFNRAIEAFDRAVAIDARSFVAHVNRGTALQQRAIWEAYHGGDAGASLREAGAALETAIALNPRSSIAFNNHGNVLQNLGRLQQTRGEAPDESFKLAIEAYGRALELNPNSWETLASRGALYDGMARSPEALADFEAALKLNPTNARLREWTEDARRRSRDF
jgi:tetratricopeptide (TPR) repeat protein